MVPETWPVDRIRRRLLTTALPSNWPLTSPCLIEALPKDALASDLQLPAIIQCRLQVTFDYQSAAGRDLSGDRYALPYTIIVLGSVGSDRAETAELGSFEDVPGLDKSVTRPGTAEGPVGRIGGLGISISSSLPATCASLRDPTGRIMLCARGNLLFKFKNSKMK